MKSQNPAKKSHLLSYSENQEPLIKPNLSRFWQGVFDYSFLRMLGRIFYSMRVKSSSNFDLRDKKFANIAFASHCGWWDGPVGYLLFRKIFNARMFMMIEELYRFPLLSKIGGLSVEKNSPRSALKALNYSVKLLKNPENSLWLFPQGIVYPPDYRPVRFAKGMSFICKRLDGINLIPIAHRYNFIREDKPEIFVEVGKPIILKGNNQDSKELTAYLENVLSSLLDSQRDDISNGRFDGYEYFFKSKLCLAKRIEERFTGFVRTFDI